MVAGSVTGTQRVRIKSHCILSHLQEQGCSLISTRGTTVSSTPYTTTVELTNGRCINNMVDVRGQTGHGGSTHRLHHEYTADAVSPSRIVCKKTSSVFMMGAKQDRLVFESTKLNANDDFAPVNYALAA